MRKSGSTQVYCIQRAGNTPEGPPLTFNWKRPPLPVTMRKSGSTQVYRIQCAGNTPEGLLTTSTRNHRLYLPRWESLAAHNHNVLKVPVTHIYRSTNDFIEKRGTLLVTAGKSEAHNYYTVRMQCAGFTHLKVYQRRP